MLKEIGDREHTKTDTERKTKTNPLLDLPPPVVTVSEQEDGATWTHPSHTVYEAGQRSFFFLPAP